MVIKRRDFVEELADSIFRIERFEAAGSALDSVDAAGATLFVNMSNDGLRPMAHQMTLDLLASLDPSLADEQNLRRVTRWTPGSSFGLPGDAAVGDLFLLGPSVAYLAIRQRGVFQQACSVHLSVLYFGRRPDQLSDYVEAMTRALRASRVIEEGAQLEVVKPEPDDTVWMDELENMTEMQLLDGARTRANLALTDRETRTRLWDLKARSVNREAVTDVERLDAAGLLEHHFVRQCHDGKEGVVCSTLEELRRTRALCTVCHKDAGDHPVVEKVTPSNLARELTDRSRWMVELSALSLQIAGVPRSSIRIPDLSRAPDPIDLVFMLDGTRYVCELKDREVNAGDAGRFLGRARALPPHRALIITTESVAGDALRVFNPPNPRTSFVAPHANPELIEGSDCVTSGLRWEIVFARLRDFASEVRLAGPGSALDVYQLLLAYFGTIWKDQSVVEHEEATAGGAESAAVTQPHPTPG